MKLKAVYASIDEIPEAFRSLYTERDGKYELTEIEGIRTSSDVERVQEALRKERGDHAVTKASVAKFSGYTPEQIREMEDEIAVLKADGKSSNIDSKVQALVDAKTKNLARDLEIARNEKKTAESERDSFKTLRNKDRIEATVVNLASGLVRPEAIEDVRLHAGNDLTIDEDGNVVTRDDYAGGSGKPAKEWLEGRLTKSVHWQIPNVGGGAGGGKGKGKVGANPWKKDSWNESEQNRIALEDPATAKRLESEAKSK